MNEFNGNGYYLLYIDQTKAFLSKKIKDFFQSHEIDKMNQKSLEDLKSISFLYGKIKRLAQENQILFEISQHNCRKCQLRMLEEYSLNRSKTPTKTYGLQKQDHHHSMHNTSHPTRSMTPELQMTGSHIGVIAPNKKKLLKGNNSGTSSIKKKHKIVTTEVFTPSRCKSPSDLSIIKNKIKITKSPTATTPKQKSNKITIQEKGKAMTPRKTNKTITPKHRATSSVSREKDEINKKSKHMHHQTSVSNEKNQINKTKNTIQTHSKIQSSFSPSPIKKNNIKTTVVGKTKVKMIVKKPNVNTNNPSNDVQNSLNEINETVKGLHESLKMIDDNDTEKIKDMKSYARSRKMIEGLDDSDEDDEEQEKRNEKMKLKREKEKRIMDKLRSEKDKEKNIREMSPDFNREKEQSNNKSTRGLSPDFNTKNPQYAISSNNMQITTHQKESQSFEVTSQKKDLYKSTNYEITSNQRDDFIGGLSSQKRDQTLNQQSKEQEIDKSNKSKGIDKGKWKKQDKSNEESGLLYSNTNDCSNSHNTHEKKKTINLMEYSKDSSNISIMKDKEKDSDLMKDKREKIREKVMEKRKEKEKSKEKILKEKSMINSTTIDPDTSSTSQRSKIKSPTLNSNSNKQDDKINSKYASKMSISPDNRNLKVLLMSLNSGFFEINKKISIVTSSPQLLPLFQMKTLLLEKISSLVRESSKIKQFLLKYDQHMFTRPFSLTKVTSSSVSLITKEEELGLCKKPQPKEILNLFTAIYIILNESHYEVPTKDLVVNLVQVLLKKYQVDCIKALILNVLPQKVNMSESQIDLLIQIKESSPNMLSASDMAKINRAASYICYVLQEIYDYVFAQYSDGTTLFQVKKAVKNEKELQTKIDFLQKYVK